MYLLVTEIESDYGASYEDTIVYDNFEGLVEGSNRAHNQDRFLYAYEIKRQINYSEVDQYITDREEKREAAIAVARAKLTVEECQLLGIK